MGGTGAWAEMSRLTSIEEAEAAAVASGYSEGGGGVRRVAVRIPPIGGTDVCFTRRPTASCTSSGDDNTRLPVDDIGGSPGGEGAAAA